MFLNKALTFRHEKNAEDFKVTREIGNVTGESIITFEYYPKNKEELKTVKDLCFQVQIKFTKLDGGKCVRIMSKRVEVTHSRQEAEKHVNVNVVGLHSQVQAAQKAAEGKYTAARMIQKRNMRMVRRTLATDDATDGQKAEYSLWNQEAVRLNDVIKKTKMKEQARGIRYDSGEEEASDSDEEKEIKKEIEKDKKVDEKKLEKHQKKEQKKAERRNRRGEDDDISNQLYQAQNPLTSAFTFDSNPLYDDN